MGFSLCDKQGLAVCGLLILGAPLVAGQELWGTRASAGAAPGLQSTGSRVVAPRLSCPEACGNLPEPGIEPVSPGWAGRFFTSEPSALPPGSGMQLSTLCPSGRGGDAGGPGLHLCAPA